MKVLQVYRDSYPPLHGGIEQHIRTLAHQLKRDVAVEILACNERRFRLDDGGVTIHSVGQWGRVQGAPVAPWLPWSLRRHAGGLLHFHSPNPAGELAFLLSGMRAPCVATYHTGVVRQARLFRFYRPLYRAFLARQRRILVATPRHLEGAELLKPFAPRCVVVPYGIDVSALAETPSVSARAAEIRRRFGPRIVLFVGRLRYYKGLEFLLKAMTGIEGRLLLVGRGEREPALRRQADELGLGDRVAWLGHLDGEEFAAALHAADVFCLPSSNRMEMFGIAQVEAHACGKPVVSTALGTGVEWVNQHGHTGLVVPPCDADALAAALDRLLSDPDLRAALGAAARARAWSEFRQETMAERTLAVYRHVLEEAAG